MMKQVPGNKLLDTSTTQKKASKSVKNEASERRQELMSLVEKVGIRNATNRTGTLAKHYGVSERAIYRDFSLIKKRIKFTDIKEVQIELGVARDQALSVALEILASPGINVEQKLKAIDSLIRVGRHYREELEAWGIKPETMESQETKEKEKVIVEIQSICHKCKETQTEEP